jgi:hypothetical protein
MSNFNKFGFISDLELEISIEKPQDITQFIYEQIDNACMYYSDCFEICQALNVTSFETEYGFAKNITELASYSLSEFVFENISINS